MRIQILDLPHLEDLTPEELKELFGAGPRSFKPGLEALEDRMLRSVMGAAFANVHDLVPASAVQGNTSAYLQQPSAAIDRAWLSLLPTIPDLRNVDIQLVRSDTRAVSDFHIATQNGADVAGWWNIGSDLPGASAGPDEFVGHLSLDPQGNTWIVGSETLSGPNGSVPLWFAGRLTDVPPNIGIYGQITPAHYHLDLDLDAQDLDALPSYGLGADPYALLCSGDQRPAAVPAPASITTVTDLTGISLTMAAQGSGAEYTLSIDSQTDNGDGTAFFTGAWNGAAVVGVMVQVKGVVDIRCYTQDGRPLGLYVIGQPGAYQWFGALGEDPESTGALSGPYNQVQLSGGQIQPDLGGVSFTVAAQETGATATLSIASQTDNGDYTWTVTGTWQGNAVTGVVRYNVWGSLTLDFTTADGSSFVGHISGQAGAYHLDADVVSANGTSSIHFSGDQTQPAAANPTGQMGLVAAATPGTAAVTDLSGTVFTMDTGDTFSIDGQADNGDGTASFTGTWQGATVAGVLSYDVNGNISVTFSSPDGSGVSGAITGQPGSYHLDATLSPSDGSSAVHVAGDQNQPATTAPAITDLSGTTFSMNTGDTLSIDSQADNGDGTASFTGTWQGATVSGVVSYDANGNILVAFSTADGSSFNGTITGQSGTYHLDATLTTPDGSSVAQLAGDQLALQFTAM